MTGQANAYRVLAGPQEFLAAGFNLTAFYTDLSYTDPYTPSPSIQDTVNLALTLQHNILNTANFERMDTVECANAYAQQYVSKWGDLLILENITRLSYTADAGQTPNLYTSGLPTVYPSYAWQYPGGSDCESLRPPNEWKPFDGIAIECWAEEIAESCTLNFSLTLGLIVLACNATKFVCMAMTIWRHRKPALITIGDAIQSFLDRPDVTTSGKSLYSGNQMDLFHEWSRTGRTAKPHQKLVNESRLELLTRPIYKSEKRSWASFASLGRWLACLCL